MREVQYNPLKDDNFILNWPSHSKQCDTHFFESSEH